MTTSMITQFWSSVQSALTGFMTAVSSGITSATALAYNSTDGFTVVGELLLIAIGVGIGYFAIRFILKLVRRA